MKIDTITIKNFRCFDDEGVEIDLQPGLTAFVGNNGSGKTAVFAALSKLFGTSTSQRAVRKEDFHVGIDTADLEAGTELEIECVFSFPELDDDDADQDAVPDFFHAMAASKEDAPLKVRIRLKATWLDDNTPDGVVEEDLRWIQTLDDEFEWDDCKKVQPTDRALVQLVYVPATRNASDQVTNLLKGRLWRAARWSDALKKKSEDGSAQIQAQFEKESPSSFIAERLDKRWADVNEGGTDTRPSLRLISSQLDDLVKQAEFVFSPKSGERLRSIDDLSDGQRSLFHIALTAATLEIERDALAEDADDCAFDQDKLRRTHLTLLAIEEPENSLSPFYLARVASLARSIGEMEGAQVLISSHSPSILSRVEADEVRYCRLGMSDGTSDVRPLKLPPDASDAGKYIRLAVRAYPELYFAKFVILAEGDSEAIVLPQIAEASGLLLDRSFVPIVPLGGRFVTHFWKLLNDLKIPHATLLDLDLGREHGGKNAIKLAVKELKSVGRDMSKNKYVLEGTIDLSKIDEIDDDELLGEDQNHPWICALRREAVYFSTPIDLDFAMLLSFPADYKKPRPNGTGPSLTDKGMENAKKAVLKSNGNLDLYDDGYKGDFSWYSYHFLSHSKPDSHLAALSGIAAKKLATDAPKELLRLLDRVAKTLSSS